MHRNGLVRGSLVCSISALILGFGSVTFGQSFEPRVIAKIGGTLGNRTVTSLGSSWVSLNDRGDVAFQASFTNADGTFGGGIFINDRLVAEVGQELHGKVLTSVGVPSLNNLGDVAFSAHFQGGQGVFTLTELIADTTEPHLGRNITGINSVIRINDLGEVLFSAAIGPGSSALFTRSAVVAETGVAIDGRAPMALSEPDLNDLLDVVFFDSVARSNPFDQALMTATDVLVETQDVIQGATVTRINDPAINNNREVVFVGGPGVFQFDLASKEGQFLLPLPKVVDGQIIDVVGSPQLNDNGELAYTALFDNRRDRGVVASGELVIRSGDVLDGNVFSAPGGFLAQNNRGEVAFLALFTDFQKRAVVMMAIADSDGDGIPDDEDACPQSDLGDTVVVDACDTGVTNEVFADGCSLGDAIADIVDSCFAGSSNHGQAVSCITHATNDLKKSGIISGGDKGAIQSCVP